MQRPPDLVSDKYGSPLNLQVAALTALLQAGPHPITEPGDRSREDVLLDHERRYWRRTASERHLDYQPDTLELAVAAATLLGASTEQEATATLARVPSLQDQSHDARLAVARWIADLYPTAHDQYWGSLQPDELGDRLIVDAAASSPGLVPQLVGRASDTQATHALVLLARVLPRKRSLIGQGIALLSGAFERLSLIALTVASQAKDPEPLTESVLGAAKDVPIDIFLRTLEQIPMGKSVVGEAGVRLAIEAVSRLHGAADSEPDIYRPILGYALINLSKRQAELGRREEALGAAEESVAIYRTLAAERPDVVLPDLGNSLNNLAGALAGAGRREEALGAAEESVAIYRTLAASGRMWSCRTWATR